MNSLDDRERHILVKRFGLDGGNPDTLEQVGKRFKVTRERIRQLQNVALRKLRRALSRKENPELKNLGIDKPPARTKTRSSEGWPVGQPSFPKAKRKPLVFIPEAEEYAA